MLIEEYLEQWLTFDISKTCFGISARVAGIVKWIQNEVKIEAKYDFKQGKGDLGILQQLCSWLVESSGIKFKFGYMQEVKVRIKEIPGGVEGSGMWKQRESIMKNEEWIRAWGRKIVWELATPYNLGWWRRMDHEWRSWGRNLLWDTSFNVPSCCLSSVTSVRGFMFTIRQSTQHDAHVTLKVKRYNLNTTLTIS